MFRLVADITELNIDQVKLPKIPGLGNVINEDFQINKKFP